MRLEPLPQDRYDSYDSDSLVYVSDDTLLYAPEVPQSLVEDILNKEFQIYSGYYTYHRGDDCPRLYYLGRGKRTGKYKLKIMGFYPYGAEYNENGVEEDYLGRKCEKLEFRGQHPSKVAKYRDIRTRQRYPQPLESDILFHRRYMIDMYDYFKPNESIEPKIAVLDIENNYPISDEIISFAINGYDDYIYYESKYDGSSEDELIDSIIEQVKKYDIITGWNIDFDAKEINKKSKIKLHEVVSIVDLHTDDAKSIAKKMYGKEIRGRWSLDNVGSRLCGIAKPLDEDDMKMNIRDLPSHKLLIYNVMDTIIPEIIDEYLGGLDTHLILSWSLHSCIDDMIITAVVNDIALLRAYHKAGKYLPSRHYEIEPKLKTGEYKYKAAEPDARPGVYDDIIGLDIVHAYPSAVISKNISPESKDPNGKYLTPSTPLYPNGVRFNDNNSIFITTLKELMEDRGRIKSKLKLLGKEHQDYKKLKFMDFALKTEIAALSHGMFGWSKSRVRDYEIADAITAVVREIINAIKDACDLIGHKWVYSHTDSAFLLGKKDDAERITKYMNDIVAKHCEGYKIIPELEFDGYYPIGYIHSPARRVLVPEGIEIDDDENWIVKGMNFMRSECPEPLADIEIELIKMKLKRMPIEELLKVLEKRIIELKGYNTVKLALIKPFSRPIDKFGKKKLDGTIGYIPYHISALMKAQDDYGLDIPVGSKFGLLPIITDEIVGIRVKKRKIVKMAFPLDTGLPSDYEIDWLEYLTSNLFGKINSLFDMTPKELEKEVLTDDVKNHLGIVDLYVQCN